jgi:hypothetical protein
MALIRSFYALADPRRDDLLKASTYIVALSLGVCLLDRVAARDQQRRRCIMTRSTGFTEEMDSFLTVETNKLPQENKKRIKKKEEKGKRIQEHIRSKRLLPDGTEDTFQPSQPQEANECHDLDGLRIHYFH